MDNCFTAIETNPDKGDGLCVTAAPERMFRIGFDLHRRNRRTLRERRDSSFDRSSAGSVEAVFPVGDPDFQSHRCSGMVFRRRTADFHIPEFRIASCLRENGVEDRMDFFRAQLPAGCFRLFLYRLRDLFLHLPRHLNAVDIFQYIGDTSLAGLAVDAD